MKLLILLTIITTTAMASSFIPPFGMQCSSDDQYTINIFPKGISQLQFDLKDRFGLTIDNNFHSFQIDYEPSSMAPILSGNDGSASFKIIGLKKDQVYDAEIYYTNEALDLKLFLNHCDLL